MGATDYMGAPIRPPNPHTLATGPA